MTFPLLLLLAAACGAGGATPAVNDASAGGGQDGPAGPCSACGAGERCVFDTCVPDVACTTGDDCQNDSYCAPEGHCVPWGLPPSRLNDVTCERMPIADGFSIELQCAFENPPEDQDPASNQVMATPTVADLNMDGDAATRKPSIVFTTFASGNYYSDGILRIIDGGTCAHQQSLRAAEDRVNPSATTALADLDGDGDVEIVALAAGGGVIAFARGDDGRYARLWTSARCDQGGRTPYTARNSLPDGDALSIHDLDDDGKPEIVQGAIVYGADGCLRDDGQGLHPYYYGQMPVLADVDVDGKIEWVGGDALYEFTGGKFVPEVGFTAAGAHGFVAVGDFGDFGDGPGRAEVVVVSSGYVRLQRLTGEVVFGPLTISGLPNGGPPTVADFDGDGKPEFAVAGGSVYAVFAPKCDMDPLPEGCAERGVLWRSATQDASSSITGSSVFDFEGDGQAEAVYADECFLRIYDGKTGAVKASVANSSGTFHENPLVADVDGDFHSEIVVGANDFYGTGCPAEDPHDPTVKYVAGHGVRVYRSKGDTWVNSRPIWNQHAYSVTNVGDDGKIPRTSEWRRNWSVPALNDFRRNIQGGLNPLAAPDLTASCTFSKACPAISFACKVCNRGAESVAGGITVAFREGDGAAPFCSAATGRGIAPGACADVACTWAAAATAPREVRVTVDDGATSIECREKNNLAILKALSCP